MNDRGELDLCFTLALTFYPLPQERKWQLAGIGCVDERPANPVARIFMETANNSPSPWGEGRDEGGRGPFEISHRKLFYWTPDVRFPPKIMGFGESFGKLPKNSVQSSIRSSVRIGLVRV